MTAKSSQLPSTPYRGIEPYRFVDRRIFFARKLETLDLLRSVIISKGVLFYGNSGTGKSSLINAGLIPEILEKGFSPDRIRLQNRLNGEIIVERISLKDDGQAPFLSPSLAAEESDAPAAPRTVFSLAQFKKKLQAYTSEHRALLIFDQFEELITLFEEAPTQAALKDALALQQKIMNVIVEILHSDAFPLKILFAFREDYLAKLNKLFVMAPELPNQYVRVTLPRRSALKDIIGGPFKDKELKDQFGPRALSGKLINKLNSEFTVRSESDEVNLFEVQIACLELWESEDPDQTYKDRVGVPGLLVNYFDRQIDKLAAANLSEPAIALLGAMVTPSGARNVVSQYTLIEQVKSSDHFNEPELKNALAALIKDTGLVRGEWQRDSLYYEITSESMSSWILKKRKERIDKRLFEQAEKEKILYEMTFRRQRRRTSLILLTLLALAASTFAAALYYRYVNTRDQLYEAKQRELQLKEKELMDAIATAADLSYRTKAVETAKDEALNLAAQANARLVQVTREREEALAQRDAALSQEPVVLVQGESKKRRHEDRRPTMFGSTMLEVAIGLVMVFLLLSLICTSVNEFIAAVLNLRAKDLEKGIRELLGDPALAEKLYWHPLIKALRLGRRPPAYIPSATFALALMDMVAPTGIGGTRSLSDVREQLASLPDSDLKKTLLIVTDEAGDNINKARLGIENWFNSSMDRVSGLYRQRAQWILLSLGLLLSVVLNVDPMAIGNHLSRDSALRSALVAEAQSIADQPQFTRSTTAQPVPRPSPADTVGSSPRPTPTPGALDAPALKSATERIKENLASIEGLGLPIGWSGVSLKSPSQVFMQVRMHWLGWLLTAFAVSLGAPFWFDILNKFIVVRSTIKPHEKSPEQPSKDRTNDDMEEGDSMVMVKKPT